MRIRTSTSVTIALAALMLSPLVATPVVSASETDAAVVGSGSKYTTEVSRTTQGTLSDEDLRQASVLTGQVLGHVASAVDMLGDRNAAAARGELKDAETLIGIVRDILPVTEITTVVRDAQGKEAYRHTEAVQDDVIELFTEVSDVDVLDTILNAKKSDEEGPEYMGSVQLYTSVLADLGYIERKIKTATQMLDTPDEAREQLVLAEINGVDMSLSEVESPLLEARRALKMAETQVDAKAYDLARENLTSAKLKLEEYQTLLGTTKTADVKAITTKIDGVLSDIKDKDAPETIRECWNMTVRLFDNATLKTARSTDSGTH
jgi:hypothetical protein